MSELKNQASPKSRERASLGMMLVTIGVVFGDIGTSPMYVMKSIVSGNGGLQTVSDDLIIGSLSLVIWTITLLTTVKYVLIAMKADNHGEGGIFSLYTIVRNCGKALVIPAMVGGAALLADGVLTPAVTVTTAIEGLRTLPALNRVLGEGQTVVIIITITIIALLFFIQKNGTASIGKAFGPVMLIWFLFLGVTGIIYASGNLSVFKALNPVYAIKVLYMPYNRIGLVILGSVFLATTGAEALYSDMGHVGRPNIYCTWPFVKICLILNYAGQCAWLINNRSNSSLYGIADLNPFFQMLPQSFRPLAVILGTLAAIIASQALITGSYTLVSEAINLDLLPHMEIRYPADTKGQLYIPMVNSIMWVLCTAVILWFRSSARMEAAYGLSITITMLMTTVLLTIYVGKVRGRRLPAVLLLIVFGVIEIVFLTFSLTKFAHGGYVTVVIALLIFSVMYIWKRGTEIEKEQDISLKVSEYIPKLKALSEDRDLPKRTENMVYLVSGNSNEYIDRDILYSILDKDPKRADAYWFLNVRVTDEPYTASYDVETYGSDLVYYVTFHLGYKVNPAINVYLYQVVSDLMKSGELPRQSKKHSIYADSGVGNFKFGAIIKTVPSGTTLSSGDTSLISLKYAIRKLCGSKVKWYGLENSSLIFEQVPLFIPGKNSTVLKRI